MSSRVIRKQEGDGIPIRQPSVALLTVNTADRLRFGNEGYAITPTPSINNLLINTQQTLIQGYFTRLALTELNIPWNIPNVNARNNTFTLRLSPEGTAKAFTATVPEGFYNGQQLATALNQEFAALLAADPNPAFAAEYDLEFTYVAENCQFIIENTNVSGAAFLIEPNNLGSLDDLTNMMGFGAIPNTFSSRPEWRGGYASLQYTPFIDIISQQLTKKQKVNDGSTSFNTGRRLLHRLYLTPRGYTQLPMLFEDATGPVSLEMPGTKPFIIHEEFSIPKQIAWDAEEFINILDLTLNDYKGNLLYEVPNEVDVNYYQLGTANTNWALTFQITEE